MNLYIFLKLLSYSKLLHFSSIKKMSKEKKIFEHKICGCMLLAAVYVCVWKLKAFNRNRVINFGVYIACGRQDMSAGDGSVPL